MTNRPYYYALFALALLSALCAFLGVHSLGALADIHAGHGHGHHEHAGFISTLLSFKGYFFVLLSVLLGWFHRWAAYKLLWLCAKIHRWFSALLMTGAIGVEGLMHILGVPHMEGWWLTMFAGSAFLTGMSVWLSQCRKKIKHKSFKRA